MKKTFFNKINRIFYSHLQSTIWIVDDTAAAAAKKKEASLKLH